MKKTILYISISLALFTVTVVMPHVMAAQGDTGVGATLTTESGCTWSGSDLTVLDEDLCIITGTVTATSVLIQHDANASGQAGGKLIVGGTSTNTTFTVSGSFTANGIVEIGAAGNPTHNSTLVTNGTFNISSTGSDGIFTIVSNTNGANSISANNYTMNIGSASTAGVFVNNDDGTSTMTSVSLYGTFNNAAGTITLTGTFIANGSSNAYNGGILNFGSGTSEFKDTSTFNNAGTLTLPAGANYVYYGWSSGSPTITNSGTFTNGYHYLYGASSVTNTGTINITSMAVFSTTGFANNSTGDVNIAHNLVVNTGLFNNKDTATVTASGATYIYNTTGTINNYSTFETNTLQFGILATVNGGTFNNYGSLTFPTPSDPAINIYRGGNLNNASTGTIVAPNNIFIEGLIGQTATLTNANTTDANAVDVIGNISMNAYSKINNNGNMTVRGPNTITINANDTDIINGANGILNINGDLTLGYDAYLDNDGTVNIAGVSSTASNLILNTSAVFHTKGATAFTGTYQKVQLNNSAQLNVGSAGSLISSPATAANSTLELNNSSSITNAGDITFKGTVSLNNSSSITNDDSGGAATFTIDDASTFANTLTLNDSATTTDNATFTNAAGAITTIGAGTTSSTDGRINVYNAGQFNNTGGTVSAATLYIGSQGAAKNGGTYTNSGTTGSTTLRYTSTTAGNYGIYIYQGHLVNSNATTSPSFICNAMIYLNGSDATEENKGRLSNSGIFEQKSTALDILSYSELNLTGGRLVQTNAAAGTLTASATTSSVNISAGASLSYPTITITNGLLDNSGTIQRLNIAGTPQVQPITLTVSNSSTFNNNSGAYFRPYSGTTTFNDTSTFANAGAINYIDPTGERQGAIYVYTSTAVTNTGTIYASTFTVRRATFNNNLTINSNYVNVGDIASPTAIFNNNGTLTANTNLNIGNAANNGTVFNNDGTVTATTGYVYSPGVYTNYITRTSTINNIYIYGGAAFTNNGTLTGTGGFNLGTETITGGDFDNNGTVNYTGSGFSRVYTPGTFTNAAGKSASMPYLQVYKGGKFENYGTNTGNTLYIGTQPTNAYRMGGVYNNYSTGVANYSGSFYLYTSDTPSTQGIFNNISGAGLTVNGSMNIGDTTYNGGTFNNYSAPSSAPYTTYGVTTYTKMYIRNGGVFNNEQDATVRAHSLWLGHTSGALSYYNQKAGSAPPAQYTETYALSRFTTDHMYIAATGRFVSQNFINQRSGQIQLNATGGQFLGQDGTGTNSYTRLDSASGSCSLTVQAGSMIIDPNSTFELTTSCPSNISSTGQLTINGTGTFKAPLQVNNGGKFYSGNNSTLSFESSGWTIDMYGSSPFIELAGDVITDVLYANNSNGGEICIGDYVGTHPSGTCTRNASGSLTIDEGWHITPNVPDTAIGFFVKNTTASTTTTVNIANDVISWAGVGAENGPSGAQSIINVMDGATVTVHGRYLCNNTEYCSLAVGTYNSGAGSAIVNLYGTYNVASDSTGKVLIGQASGGMNTLNIKSDVTLGHGLLTTTTTSQPFIVYGTGKLNIERTDALNYGEMYNAGSCTISGLAQGTDGNRGANINGKMSCYGALTVNSTGSMDVGRISDTAYGEVYVNGSTTTISGFTELDGLLDTGSDVGDSLTVTSTGHISSGEGTATNFKILAYDLTVQTGGKISSDGASSLGSASDQPGSYGGDGAGRAGTTYGTAKFIDMNSSTAVPYGEPGRDSGGAVTAKGGGGVRINAAGNIVINGTISANGADATGLSGEHGGAGGTVLINHDITHLDTSTTFTGTGLIYAYGGAGDGTGRPGGGGRIIINSILFDKPDDGTDSEYGFEGAFNAGGGANGGYTAAAGTIVFLGDDNNPNGSLYVDQGGAAPTTGSITYIRNTGDFIFDRVEGYDGAQLTYEAAPATLPVSCYETGTVSSSVTIPTYTCTPNPDKPHTMYINNSVTGAQLGTEPAGASPLEVGDLTPVFSVVHANPEISTAVSKVHIQVSADTNSNGIPFEQPGDTMMWDTTTGLPITLATAIAPGQRSEDIEYAGAALSPGTTYYVRMALMDPTDPYTGLWTHRDIGQHYNFEINNYFDIYPKCTNDTFAVEDANSLTPPEAIRNQPGKRFGAGLCTMGVLSGNTGNWQIKFGMAASEGSNQTIAFNTVLDNLGDYITPIDNLRTPEGCDMDETGNTEREEYAFNIHSDPAINWGNYVNDTEGECNDISFGQNEKYHDVEIFSAMNKIITGTGTTASEKTFPLNIYVNVDRDTVPSAAYSLDMAFIMTTDP